jgi:hypothetical protein
VRDPVAIAYLIPGGNMNARTLVVAALAFAATGTLRGDVGDQGAIAWYGTWERGLRVAKATNRPILLIAAAPQCHGVSGLW